MKTIELISLITAIILKGKECNSNTEISNLALSGAEKVNELYCKKKACKLTPMKLISKIDTYFNLEKSLSITNTRKGFYPVARRIACKLLKDNFNLSYKDISTLLLYKNGDCIKNTIYETNKALLYHKRFSSAYNEIKENYNLK